MPVQLRWSGWVGVILHCLTSFVVGDADYPTYFTQPYNATVSFFFTSDPQFGWGSSYSGNEERYCSIIVTNLAFRMKFTTVVGFVYLVVLSKK